MHIEFPKTRIKMICVVIGGFLLWLTVDDLISDGFAHPKAIVGGLIGFATFTMMGLKGDVPAK